VSRPSFEPVTSRIQPEALQVQHTFSGYYCCIGLLGDTICLPVSSRSDAVWFVLIVSKNMCLCSISGQEMKPPERKQAGALAYLSDIMSPNQE
jgi:hypothetical protein